MDYYQHDGRPPEFSRNPVDSDTTEWFYFVLGGVWDQGVQVNPPALAPNETIQTIGAMIKNGQIDDGPTEHETMTDSATGYELRKVYAIRAKPTINPGQGSMRITLRYSTLYDSNPGRTDLDRSIDIPVEAL